MGKFKGGTCFPILSTRNNTADAPMPGHQQGRSNRPTLQQLAATERSEGVRHSSNGPRPSAAREHAQLEWRLFFAAMFSPTAPAAGRHGSPEHGSLITGLPNIWVVCGPCLDNQRRAVTRGGAAWLKHTPAAPAATACPLRAARAAWAASFSPGPVLRGQVPAADRLAALVSRPPGGARLQRGGAGRGHPARGGGAGDARAPGPTCGRVGRGGAGALGARALPRPRAGSITSYIHSDRNHKALRVCILRVLHPSAYAAHLGLLCGKG